MSHKVVLLSPPALQRVLTRIAHEIAEKNEEDPDLVLIGIQRERDGDSSVDVEC